MAGFKLEISLDVGSNCSTKFACSIHFDLDKQNKTETGDCPFKNRIR